MDEVHPDFHGLIIDSARKRINYEKFEAALCNKVAVAIRRQTQPERTRMMTLLNEVMEKSDLDSSHETVAHDHVEHDQVELESDGYNESNEEAKHPGAMLGLIMGVYPLIMVTFILVLIGYAFFVHPIMISPANTTPHQNELLGQTEN